MTVLGSWNLFYLDEHEILEFISDELKIAVHPFILHLIRPIDLVDHQLIVAMYH